MLAGSFTYSRYLLIEQNIKKAYNIRRSKESFNVWRSTRKLFQMFQIMNIERNLLCKRINNKILLTSFPSLYYASAVEKILRELIHYSLGGHLKGDCELIQIVFNHKTITELLCKLKNKKTKHYY